MGVESWHLKRIIGSAETSSVMAISEKQANGRHVCFASFNDGTWAWWPYGVRGFPAKTFTDAIDAAEKYIETGKLPKRKKDKKITLDSPIEDEEAS